MLKSVFLSFSKVSLLLLQEHINLKRKRIFPARASIICTFWATSLRLIWVNVPPLIRAEAISFSWSWSVVELRRQLWNPYTMKDGIAMKRLTSRGDKKSQPECVDFSFYDTKRRKSLCIEMQTAMLTFVVWLGILGRSIPLSSNWSFMWEKKVQKTSWLCERAFGTANVVSFNERNPSWPNHCFGKTEL